jgi:hypothetical protein
VISFVDDATTAILKQTDLDFKIESFVRDVAALALEKNIHAVMRDDPLFTYVDLIIEDGIGWSEDLGILGQQYIEKIEAAVSGFARGRLNITEVTDQLTKVIRREEPLFKKLETRFCDRELKVLSGKKHSLLAPSYSTNRWLDRNCHYLLFLCCKAPGTNS